MRTWGAESALRSCEFEIARGGLQLSLESLEFNQGLRFGVRGLLTVLLEALKVQECVGFLGL